MSDLARCDSLNKLDLAFLMLIMFSAKHLAL